MRFKVGNNGYQADIIVGITTNQIAVLYDTVNITNIKITEAPNTNLKVKDTLVRRNGTSVENSISQTPETVKENRNKFSLSDRTSAEYDLLTQENEELKAQVEALKNEMKLTKGHKVNPEAVSKLAKSTLRITT